MNELIHIQKQNILAMIASGMITASIANDMLNILGYRREIRLDDIIQFNQLTVDMAEAKTNHE